MFSTLLSSHTHTPPQQQQRNRYSRQNEENYETGQDRNRP